MMTIEELEHHLCTGDGKGEKRKREMLEEYVKARQGEPVAYLLVHPTSGERAVAFWEGIPSGAWVMTSLHSCATES